jgi:hypothetical protein
MRFYTVTLESPTGQTLTGLIQAGSEAEAIEIASACLLLEQDRRAGYVGEATPSQPPAYDALPTGAGIDHQRLAAQYSREVRSYRRQPQFGIVLDCYTEAACRTAERMRQSHAQGYWV